MKCPIDQATLLINQRSGIEIDYCPECRGVWLDRVELDKLLEREQQTSVRESSYERPDDRSQNHGNDMHAHYPQKKRKESFLGYLFDF